MMKGGKDPEVTVLMACFNAERWLAEAIESVLSQTYATFEFIIIDDGSTDTTLGIVRRYEKVDSRIKVIAKSNRGLADSLNIGISQARGQWIARMDADDWSYPERLERQVAFIREHPEVDVLGTGAELIGTDDEVWNVIFLPEKHSQIVKTAFKKTLFFHPSVMMKKSFLEEVGGYDDKLLRSQDFELWVKGIKHGYIYHNLQEVLLKYRTNNYQMAIKNITNSFISCIVISLRYRYFIKGLKSAFIGLLKNMLVHYGMYRPMSIRRKG